MEVFDQLLEKNVFDGGLIESLWRQPLQELPHFGGDDLGSVLDLKDDH